MGGGRVTGWRRRPASFWAALGHRLSGLALAAFLPVHFLALGLVLEGADVLDSMLTFAELPLIKAVEWGLVVLLALHLFFGLRLLAVEFLPWRGTRERLIAWSVGGALAVGVVFIVGSV